MNDWTSKAEKLRSTLYSPGPIGIVAGCTYLFFAYMYVGAYMRVRVRGLPLSFGFIGLWPIFVYVKIALIAVSRCRSVSYVCGAPCFLPPPSRL